jgi:TonB family protein
MMRAAVALSVAGVLGGTALADAQKTPPRKIKNVSPIYPRLSLEKGDEGIVVVEVSVSLDGAVEAVRVLRSICPRLTDAAVVAARQWRFDVVTINGRAAPYTMTASIPFRLDTARKEPRATDACRWTGAPGPLR